MSQLDTSFVVPTLSFAALTSSTSASVLSAPVSPSQDSWIIDSGTSHCMTGMSSLFKSYHISSGKDRVSIADGSYSFIVEHGNIFVTPLLLSSVLHVHNFTLNLLSISHLLRVLTVVSFSSLLIMCFKT